MLQIFNCNIYRNSTVRANLPFFNCNIQIITFWIRNDIQNVISLISLLTTRILVRSVRTVRNAVATSGHVDTRIIATTEVGAGTNIWKKAMKLATFLFDKFFSCFLKKNWKKSEDILFIILLIIYIRILKFISSLSDIWQRFYEHFSDSFFHKFIENSQTFRKFSEFLFFKKFSEI